MKTLINMPEARFSKFSAGLVPANMEIIVAPADGNDDDLLTVGGDADFILTDPMLPISARLIQNMPNLKLIQTEAVGYNCIDMSAAKAKGVTVCNAKGINAQPVAEHALMLMLGLLRNVLIGDHEVRAAHQNEMKMKMFLDGMRELSDCTIGLIGFGDIARALARLLRGFDVRVLYSDQRRPDPDTEQELGAIYMEQETLLAESDIVSLHVPVLPSTKGMVNDHFLQQMKPGSYLINTARGELVDQPALCRALESGYLAGAGLDTLAPEPVTLDNPLLHLSPEAARHVIFSPHIAGVTSGSCRRGHQIAWDNINRFIHGEQPNYIVSR